MKKSGNSIALCVLFLLLIPALNAGAQNTTNTINNTADVETFVFPQWTKDVRRFEIISFGSIPFTMLIANTAIDTYRWYNANGLDMSNEGRRYAPWPLKSAGAEPMKNSEQEATLWIAAGLSLGIAVADLVITQIKRHKARQRAERLPAGTIIITKTPWQEEPEEEAGSLNGDGSPLP